MEDVGQDRVKFTFLIYAFNPRLPDLMALMKQRYLVIFYHFFTDMTIRLGFMSCVLKMRKKIYFTKRSFLELC